MIDYPQLVNLVFAFAIHNKCTLRGKVLSLYQWLQTFVSLSAHVSALLFSMALNTKCPYLEL